MATTVSEKQTDEVDSNEPAVVSNETRSDSRISHSNHLQNGTDNSSTSLGGSNSVTSVSTKRFDMSQYLQDGNNGPHGGADSKVSSESSEQNISSESGHINDSSAPPLSQNYPPIGISSRSGPFTMDHPTGNTMDSNQYASQSIRHNFPVSKPAMIPPRSPGGVYPQQQQQRFMSGQSISQQAGPTPTLNQLLQTSNTMQRMQNSYGHAGEAMYSLNWSSQTPHGLYSSQSNASPGPTSTQLYRNPSPPFINRPAQPSTPNTNPPDSGELAVGNTNSNDSSSGQGAGTPNSQGMRPTPSPTGSTGSRSMSPAVGQQNIQMPPRPSSSQSDGSGPTRMSHSPMATQGGYQGPPPPPHISGYKIPGGGGPQSHQQGPGTPGTSGPGGPPYSSPQQQSLTQPHSQQYSSPQGYSVRPQSNMQYGPNQVYGPANTGQQSPTTNNMGPAQYSGRPMPNHFPGYPQSWTSSPGLNQGPPSSTNLVGSKGTTVTQSPGPQPTSSLQSTNSQSPRPPHYLKTHLQHKMGFGSSNTGIISSNSPPQGYSGGGPLGPGMGPPGGPGGMHHHPGSSMGPPPMGHMTHGGMSMGPPNMAPPVCSTSNSHEGPMPPPSSTPNSHVPMSMGTPAGENADAHDNGITTTASGTASTHVTPASGGSVTSVVTTGPDGTALDEGSQQSTLSNASAASGEDPQCSTPKSRKNEMGGHYSHPATPQSTVPSPGAASMNSLHADEYDISSPSWPRTPASPVFNSHVPQPDTYRSKKTDSLGKLYEMDDSPERRAWLDKLLAFMEERRTPITTCPTISKNPLDLFRLYIYVKERGGFMEVCKVTKNKTWKDIAGMLGIGASSSAAYTLRKHYTKNLLAYECKFDRGGIDPQPIINQVESTSKKKGAKSASVPSPGSSNSQDSFPTPGSSSASMDGYSGYGYPPGSTPDYNSPPMQRPASQTNAPSPHPGSGVPNHHSQGANVTQTVGGDNISVSNPFDDVTPGQSQRTGAGAPFTPAAAHQPYGSGGPPRPQGIQQGYPGQSGYSQYPGPGSSPDQYQNYPANSAYPPTTRPVGYPPYSPDGDRGTTYNQSGVNSMTTSMASNMATNNPSASTAGSSSDPYNRYNLNPNAQGGTYPPPRQNYPGTATNPNASQPNAQQPMSAAYPAHQDYYRDPNYPASGGPQGAAPGNQIYGNGPHSKTMPPPAAGGGRRHPDFAKDQSQYPPYNPQKPQMYGWPNSQYRGQYTAQGPAAAAGQQWSQGGLPPRGGTPHNTQPGATGPVVGPGPGQWGADQRYPVSSQSSSVGYQPSQQGTQWNPVPTPGVGQSSPLRPAIGARPPFRPDGKPFNLPPPQGLKTTSSGGVTSSSYSQQPLPKREITFPSDSVEATMPVLYRRKRLCRTDVAPLEAWRIMMSLRSGLLAESTWALDILNVLLFDDNSVAYFGLAHMPGLLDVLLEHFQRSLSDMFESPTPDTDKPWYEPPKFEESDVDLGAVTRPVDPSDHTVFLTTSTNYTMTTRKGMQVKTVSAKDDLFIQDNQKDWDVDGDCAGKSMIAEINTDPWQSSTSETISTKHILTCFQAEFGGVPFVRLLKKKENDTNTAEDNIWSENENENNDVNSDSSKDCANVNGDAKVKLKSKNVEKDTSDGNLSDSSNNKNSSVDKCNKRTKTVSEMLTRIKKEPDEELANDGMNIIDIGEKLKTEMDAADSKASGSDVGGSNKSNASSLSMRIGINHNGSLTEEGQDSQDTIKVKTETDLSSAEESSEIPGILKQAAESSLGSQRLKINDQACTLKRRRISDYEDEAYSRDEPSLHLITETQESLGKRCVCISAILRNLTFVPGNEMEFARNATFLSLLGKLLLLHHEHPIRTQKTRNYDREEDADFADSCSSLQGETEWWWDFLTQVRENILVASANIAGHMDLGPYDEDVSRPVLDGLLHWAVCPSAHGQDPFATVGPLSMLSPQRLALEALCKLCVTDNNVDLVIATPPYSRLERLCNVLTKLLCRSEEQVLREFAVNLLHYLAAASSGMARTVALQSPCVSLLVAFIEQAEQSALSIANQHGISALRENPDAMGTSLDMLRRAAHTLLHLARHPDNRPLFLQQEQRLLSLVMSQILDQQVATIIAKVLYQCSRPEQYQNCSTPTSTSQTSYS